MRSTQTTRSFIAWTSLAITNASLLLAVCSSCNHGILFIVTGKTLAANWCAAIGVHLPSAASVFPI
jgi:hypothetical protein